MQDLKDYLVEHNLKLDITDVKPKWKCGICKELLCNTKTSKCGCSFCQNCIETYLKNNENKTCPSCSKEFEFGMTLSDDYRTEIKIQSLVIKCPNRYCKEEMKLGDLLHHLKSCSNERVNCAFDRLGCSVTGNSNLEMNAHVNSELGQHLNLIVERLNRDEDNRVEQNQILQQRMQRIEESLKNVGRTLVDITQTLSENSTKQSETVENVSMITQKVSENTVKQEQLAKKVSEIIPMISIVTQKVSKFSEDQSTMSNKVESKLNQVIEQAKEVQFPHKYLTFTNMRELDRDEYHLTDSFELDSYTFEIRMDIINFDEISDYDEMDEELEFLVFLKPSDKNQDLKWPLKRLMKLEILMSNGIDRKVKAFDYCSAPPSAKKYYNKPFKNVFFNESRICVDYDDVVSDDDQVIVIFTLLN